MLQAFHSFGSKDAGFDYLGKLQNNNVGPSASTGKLTALVNKGELLVANGDLQMKSGADAQQPEREGVLASRAGRQTQHAGAALLHRPGARRAAKRQRAKN
ncbi:2-aminoethylphosphonate ABC transporter substrate-binding protein [Serratia marcescens]|uniref:2-aminoethylphosphonate ABC transporter substrate-binding protein n=1 Tax=Serratia marcescens TaxID=615 RepID=A0A379ZSU8_SERMA|nr:2-aminoethylphosphonate ABC transporter substrate-binding protein [Serratia marcescens]